MQVCGLIFVVSYSSVIDIGYLVEGQFSIETPARVTLLQLVAFITVCSQLFHFLMSRMCFLTIKYSPRAPTRHKLQTSVDHSQPTTALKPRVEVSNFVQLRDDPTIVNNLFIALELVRRIVTRHQCFKNDFCCEHPTLNRRMNPFEPLRVQKTGAITR